jgi:uncharacterized membrane protein
MSILLYPIPFYLGKKRVMISQVIVSILFFLNVLSMFHFPSGQLAQLLTFQLAAA